MDKDNDSLTLFNNRRYRGSNISTNELLELLEAMKRELMIIGSSPLLSAASLCCSNYFAVPITNIYIPKTYALSYSWCTMSSYDAWMLICKLAEYLQGKDMEKDIELKRWPQYFSQNMVPTCTGVKEEFRRCLEDIDNTVFRARYKAFSQYTDEPPKGMEMADSNVSKDAKSEIDALLSEAREKARAIIADASSEADTIMADATSEAKRLKDEAEKTFAAAQAMLAQVDAARASAEDARVKAETAQAQVPGPGAVRSKTSEPKCPPEIPPRQERIEESLAELRRALMDTNAQMRKLEDSILESGRDETIRQLLELYNLIADSRDSTLELARKGGGLDSRNMARNLKEFLEMIAGFLTSYGVTVHTGASGSPLNVKTQEVRNSPAQYDPRRAVISTSLRSGFVLGDVVLQKEWIQLKESVR